LPDDKREVLIEFSLSYLIASLNNSIGDFGLESITNISLSSSLLEKSESTDDRKGHSFTLTADLKVLKRTLGLGTPVLVSWNLNRAESIAFLTVLTRGENTEATDLLGEAEELRSLLGEHLIPYLLLNKSRP
jgi:hypothetical protein